MELSKKQLQMIEMILDKKDLTPIFVTGQAGTGKSFFIENLYEKWRKKYPRVGDYSYRKQKRCGF